MSPTVDAANAASVDISASRQPGINIRREDRVFIVGTTGSGKTHLCTILLARLPWVVVLDPKHQFHLPRGRNRRNGEPNALVTSNLTVASKWDDPLPIIYRPSVAECKQGCDEFWDWIWYRKQTIVYVDEVMAVSPSVNMPYGYMRCVQMGRSAGIGVWSATQRPARIPQNLISESEHYIAFELRNPRDLRRVADFTDPIIEADRARDHDFWYYDVRKRKPMKLNANMLRVK